MKKGEKTKKLILSKSLELFALNGFSGTSVRNISSAVGLRESAIYNHFKSKNDILLQLFNSMGKTTGLNLLTDELLEKLNKPDKFMQIFSEKLLKLWSQSDEIRFLNLVLKETGRKIDSTIVKLNTYVEDSQKVWIMIFSEMIKHKFIKRGDPKVYANEFIAPLFFIRLNYLLDETRIDLKSATREMTDHIEFFWAGVKK